MPRQVPTRSQGAASTEAHRGGGASPWYLRIRETGPVNDGDPDELDLEKLLPPRFHACHSCGHQACGTQSRKPQSPSAPTHAHAHGAVAKPALPPATTF